MIVFYTCTKLYIVHGTLATEYTVFHLQRTACVHITTISPPRLQLCPTPSSDGFEEDYPSQYESEPAYPLIRASSVQHSYSESRFYNLHYCIRLFHTHLLQNSDQYVSPSISSTYSGPSII
eukprot:scpid92561/ scgid8428/ 